MTNNGFLSDTISKVMAARRVYIIGNGGSYANASHICNDLLSCGIRAYTLDSATLSAFANDYGWEFAYERWLNIVGEPGDLLIAMSGSGKSKNILLGISAALDLGMEVQRIFGNEHDQNMQTAEEFQLQIGHKVRGCLLLMNSRVSR